MATPVSSTPNLPTTSPTVATPKPAVKPATTDIILYKDETTPIELMTDLIFENIGGQELINIVRADALME